MVGYALDNTNAATQALTAGQNVTDSFTVQVTDGSASSTANAVFAITGSNDTPTVSATPQSLDYANNTQFTTLFSNTAINMVDAGQTIKTLKFTVSGIDASGNDRMDVDGIDIAMTNGITGTTSANGLGYVVAVSGSTASVTVTSAAGLSQATAESVINGMAYRYATAGAMSGDRVVTLTQITDSGIDNNVTTLNLATFVKDVTPPVAQFDLVGSMLTNRSDMVYSYGNGSFYVVSSATANWNAANAVAVGSSLMGKVGHLVHVNSAAEQSFVNGASMYNNGTGWLGGSDNTTEGTWVWYYGNSSGVATAGEVFMNGSTSYINSPNGAYNSLLNPEPNGGAGENYLGTYQGSVGWFDVSPFQSYKYSTEFEGSGVLNRQIYANTATVKVNSSEAGTVYLVNAANTVTTVAQINALSNAQWNSEVLSAATTTVLSSEDFSSLPTGWGTIFPLTDYGNGTTTGNMGGVMSSFLGQFHDTSGTGAQSLAKTYSFGVANAGKTITIDFDMYEIDNWNGELFKVYVNDAAVSAQAYHNATSSIKDGGIDLGNLSANSSTGLGGSNSSTSGGSPSNSGTQFIEESHHYTLQATLDGSGNVKLGFGSGLTGNTAFSVASWGIDNVVITTAQASSQSLALTGLADGSYKLYTADAAGNLSAAANDAVTVDSTGPTLSSTTAPSTALSTIAGTPGTSAGETITLTLTFDGAVNGLTGGTDSTIFKVGDSGVSATWGGTAGSNTRTLTYTIAAAQNGQATIDEAALKTALTAGIHDVMGNAFSYTANPSIPEIDATALPVVDTTAPTPTLVSIGATNATIKSTEVGTAYLVLSSGTVNSLGDILALPDSHWSSVAIPTANADTLLPVEGLNTGDYVLYTVDAAGNLSARSPAQAYARPVMNVSMLESSSLGFQINGIDPQDSAGVSVYGVGDVNADGLDDVIVGAIYGAGGKGQAYVVFGKSSSTPVNLSDVDNGAGGTVGFAINHPTLGGQLGISVAGVGDINGDGRADLLVSAPLDGLTYVVFGKSTGSAVDLTTVTNGTGGFAITDNTGANSAGNAISSAGDFNGDGFTDFIVAAPGPVSSNTGPTAGDVFLVYGTATYQDIVLSAITAGNGGFKIAGSGTQQLGFSVSSAGDLNGDGYSDIVVSAPNDNDGAGKVVVKFGGPLANNGDFEITAPALSRLGTSVSGGGDVNGDGYADLIIGGPQRNTQTKVFSGPGKAYVLWGGATNSNIDVSAMGTRGYVINGSNTDSDAGMSVSFMGDVNGDGLSDMIVGEDLATVNGQAQAGNTYVVFGKTSTSAVELSDVAKGLGGFMVAGSTAYDRSGWSVSAAGDINGDGLADLIIGAKGESLDEITLGAGKAFVVFGSATGGYYETGVDQTAAAGGSTLTSTGGQTLLGGVGNDTLISAGADVLYGGKGSDTFVLHTGMLTALSQGYNATTQTLARVNGGTGMDTLQLSDGGTLDLTAIANTGYGLDINGSTGSRIQSIEIIDMKTDTAANTLNMRLSDVLDMSGMNLFNSSNTAPIGGTALDATVAKHQVAIYGEALDTLNLGAGTGWSNSGTVVSYDGHNLAVYNNTNTMVQLLIEQAMVTANQVVI